MNRHVLVRLFGFALLVCIPSLRLCADDVPASPESQPAASNSAEGELTVQELAALGKKSVMVISHKSRDGRTEGIGTGFVISSDGLIATNLHVIGESRSISVRDMDGKTYDVTEVHATERLADLAVIRIEAHDLPALELGDSNVLKPGASIVAIGNPYGLQNSVVDGVVSGFRDLDGTRMLQLAIPVETGNSGGPVLDRMGRVQGIMTLKSALTENLGFAVAISALKPLLDKPNPVPMARWLTIGALNPRDWIPLFGANWRQRAGRIYVDGTGGGFGGRSLCLWQRELPQLPFEMGVAVKMKQDDGAAGLVFHADGENRHYGFYPSSGRVRLSRFDGANVFSWQVLREVDTPAYREGEWNRLKVRVEDHKILCYVNEQLVIESSDARLTSGAVGLAKFRHTEAEFKEFHVGEEVSMPHASPEAIERVANLVEDIPADRAPDYELTEQLLTDSVTNVAVLRERARHLEGQARQLRALAQSVHQKSVQAELAELVNGDQEQVDLTRAALLVARLENDELDVEAYVASVDRMASDIKDGLGENASEDDRLAALNDYLFNELGFHGSRSDYYTRSNSYLNEVIDDREGIPITLSVLYMELGKRVGLTMEAVGLPGHFVVRFVPTGEGQSRLIDVFEKGTTLTQDQANARVLSTAGVPLNEAHLRPQSARDIIVRMLVNLERVARDAFDSSRMLLYVDSIVRLDPEAAEYRWLRALLEFDGEQPAAAATDIDWLLENRPPGIDINQVLRLQQVLEQKTTRSVQPAE